MIVEVLVRVPHWQECQFLGCLLLPAPTLPPDTTGVLAVRGEPGQNLFRTGPDGLTDRRATGVWPSQSAKRLSAAPRTYRIRLGLLPS